MLANVSLVLAIKSTLPHNTNSSMSKQRHFKIKQLLVLLCLQQLHYCCANAIEDSSSCSSDGIPVCARDANDFILFPNECALQHSNRAIYVDQQFYKKTKLINCLPGCNLQCPQNYAPVCAVNQVNGEEKNFDNLCEVTKQSCIDDMDWVVVATGKCIPAKILNVVTPKPLPKRRILRKRRRPIKCKNILNPVCATFAGVKSTFKNECLVNAENIRTGKTWEIFAEGICEEDYASLAGNEEAKNKKSIHKYHSLGKHYGLLHKKQYLTPQLQQQQQQQQYEQQPQQKQQYVQHQQQRTSYNDGLTYIVSPTVFHTETVAEDDKIPYGYTEEEQFDFQNFTNQMNASPMVEIGNMIKDLENCHFGNEPICGVSGSETKTFKNMCELIFININGRNTWSILHDGACPSCDFNCPNTYEPVCVAHNNLNVTIANRCQLRAQMCENRNDTWTLLYNGACQYTTQQMPTTTTTAAPPAKTYFLLKNAQHYGLHKKYFIPSHLKVTKGNMASDTEALEEPAVTTTVATPITAAEATTKNYVMIIFNPEAKKTLSQSVTLAQTTSAPILANSSVKYAASEFQNSEVSRIESAPLKSITETSTIAATLTSDSHTDKSHNGDSYFMILSRHKGELLEKWTA